MDKIIELKKNAEMFYTEIALSDVADVYTGKQLNKSDMSNDGLYAVMNGGIEPSGYTNNYNEEENTITISQGGASAGYVNWNSEKIWIGAHCYAIHPIKNKINNRYLYFVLKEKQEVLMQSKQGAGIPGLNRSIIQKLYIPLPHTNVQKRIVEILDSFTNLIDALNEELSLRQKQFEYYREKLLTFDENINNYCFKEIFDTKNGYTPSTSNDEYWENGVIPWFRMEDIRQNGRILSDSSMHITSKGVKGGRLFKAGSIILATSATIGEHALILVEHLSNQRFTNIYPNKDFESKIKMKYVYYYMYIIDEWCKLHINQGGFASVDMDGLYKLKIPIPSLDIQQSIVEKLDAFESLISSLKEEIALRQKQYEYYREKLLTFD